MNSSQSNPTEQQLRHAMVSIGSCPDFDSALQCLLHRAIELTGMDCGAVYLIETDRAVLRHQHALKPELLSEFATRPLSLGYIQAALGNPSDLIDVAAQFPDYAHLGNRLGTPHLYSIALQAGAEPFGFMNVASSSPVPPAPALLEFLRILAHETAFTFVRLRTEARLREALSQLEGTLESTADGILVADSRGRMTRFNRKFAQMWQLPTDLLESGDDTRALQFVLAQLTEPARFLSKVQELYGQPEAVSFDVLEFKDGRVFERYSQPQWIGREVVGRVWSFRDVTASKRAELALREQHALLAHVIDGTGVGTWQWNIQTGETRFDQRWAQIVGYTIEELSPTSIQTWLKLVHPDDLQLSEAALQRHFAGETERYDCECRMRHKDGSWVWVHDRGKVFQRDADGSPRLMSGTHTDITERRVAAQKLQDQEMQLRRLGDNLPAGVVYQLLADESGGRRFAYVSAGLERVTGIKPEEALADASVLYRQILPEDRLIVDTREAECLRTMSNFSAEVRIRKPDGEVRWIYLHSAPVRMPTGTTQWDGLVLDITEHKLLEERVRHSQKMEGIGHLAGGMAHEFNNILGAITLRLDLLRLVTREPETREIAGEMQALSTRAADLIRQLLAFSRRSVLQREPVDIGALVARQAKILGRLLGERIRLTVDCGSDLPAGFADAGCIEQVLLNLCLNARDAMPATGTLSIRVQAATISSAALTPRRERRAGRFLCVEVSDTGCGMTPETLDRLFEPFFTTKVVGKGTGLGLATVRGIIEQHEGWVEVDSTPGQGSTFRVFIPVAAERNGRPGIATFAPQPATARILIVEDEPAVRRAAKALLTHHGYEVLEAADAREAFVLWEQFSGQIDLLYTDMVMPGELTGKQLAEHLLAEKPSLRVIVTSGYNTTVSEVGDLAENTIVYLPKPCPPAMLTTMIQRCLGPRS